MRSRLSPSGIRRTNSGMARESRVRAGGSIPREKVPPQERRRAYTDKSSRDPRGSTRFGVPAPSPPTGAVAEDRAERAGCVAGTSVERTRCTGLAPPSAACATLEEKAESELRDNMRE